jgi:hypothetical protein
VPQPDSDSSDEDLPLARKLLKQPEARVAASLRAGVTAPSEAARREIQTVHNKTPQHSAQDGKQDKSVKTGINSDVFARQHIANRLLPLDEYCRTHILRIFFVSGKSWRRAGGQQEGVIAKSRGG